MYSPNIIVYTTAVLAFFLSFTGFYILRIRNEEFSPYKNTPFLIFLPTVAISFITLLLLLDSQPDFIYSPNIITIIATILGSGIIYCSARFLKLKKLHALTILICSVIICLLIPNDFTLIPQLSPILSKIIICLGLFVFSYFYPISNNIDTLTTIQTMGISTGIYFLALLGGTPILTGAYALSLNAVCIAFLVFNRYPAQLSFISAGCQALGFITGCLMIQSVIEGCSIAVLIFSMFFWIELISAILRKMFDWQNNFALHTYTNCHQANLSGFPPYTIAGHILRLQIVLIIVGCFAIYAPEGLTIPIFGCIITIWYISKIKNWQTSNKTIKELNNDLMNNIRNNLNNLKEQINKDKN